MEFTSGIQLQHRLANTLPMKRLRRARSRSACLSLSASLPLNLPIRLRKEVRFTARIPVSPSFTQGWHRRCLILDRQAKSLTATLSRSSSRLSRWSLESRVATPALLATQRESPTLATIRLRDRPSNRTTSPVEPLVSPSCSHRRPQNRQVHCADGVRKSNSAINVVKTRLQRWNRCL